MSSSNSLRSDDELLRLAKTVLSEQAFEVQVVADEIELILAENHYFVVAVAATNTIGDLILAEPMALQAIARLIETASLGPKTWDTYLVLLTQERSADDDAVTRDLYSINYDTSRLRRIAHTGVDPTIEAVTHALAPFVEPSMTIPAEDPDDGFSALLQSLVERGVDQELARRAITAFGQGASLDDVL